MKSILQLQIRLFLSQVWTREPVFRELVFRKPVSKEPVFREPVFRKLVFKEPVFREPVSGSLIWTHPEWFSGSLHGIRIREQIRLCGGQSPSTVVARWRTNNSQREVANQPADCDANSAALWLARRTPRKNKRSLTFTSPLMRVLPFIFTAHYLTVPEGRPGRLSRSQNVQTMEGSGVGARCTSGGLRFIILRDMIFYEIFTRYELFEMFHFPVLAFHLASVNSMDRGAMSYLT